MSQMESVVEKSKDLIGEILIRRERITEGQLQQALGIQTQKGGIIGEILVDLGFIDEKDVLAALIVQCNLPYVALNKYQIDKNAVAMIPYDLSQRHQVIAIDHVGEALNVVMRNPLDVPLKAELNRITQCRIIPFIATGEEIQEAINRCYDGVKI